VSNELLAGIQLARAEAERKQTACGMSLAVDGWRAPVDGSLPACATALKSFSDSVSLRHSFPDTLRFSANGLVIDGGGGGESTGHPAGSLPGDGPAPGVGASGPLQRRSQCSARCQQLPGGAMRGAITRAFVNAMASALASAMTRSLQAGTSLQRSRLERTRLARALLARTAAGFTLVELLLALGLGLLVASLVIEALLSQGRFTAALLDRLHQRDFVRRARRLIEDDRRLAMAASNQLGNQVPACNLSGRQPLLHLQLASGRPGITWSLGTAPSTLWRGKVLMRCGPAYGLDGEPTLTGSWQNRVVLDQAEGFEIPL
jgi:hypothetical protein